VNANLFKTYTTLVPPNGSGDKSTDWTELKLELILALLVCIIWTMFDRRSKNYNQGTYWLRQLIRYGLLVNCFYYGVGKIALTQMHFPTLIRLWGKIRNDSIYAELKRSNRHFQLAEKQFHWLSEYNR
jgi:hypothetical protein